MNWYALFVPTGKEETVQKFLRLHFDEHSLYSLVPKRRVPEKRAGVVHHVLRNIFPGYVLIRTNMNSETFHKMNSIPVCFQLVNNGTYYSKEEGVHYSIIRDEEMTPILQLIGEGDTVDYSGIYIRNSKVFVKSGPLQGMEGIIKRVDPHKNRAKILLNFMGTEKTIDVGIEVLSKT
ncbi:antiterminator LoaP [Brevibacillus dissolubilis]|uniref:antiterminator LoaP n=1 Tax=Brevibacillus dissolubilis TaxID=1844116 RepID=UPI0011177874|nr:antiterminator LoaP [Brevibacillus dissolubilis]